MKLTGKVFGDYKAIKEDGYDSSGHVMWIVKCTKCEKEKRVRRSDLLSGRQTICKACLRKSKLTSIIKKLNPTSADNEKQEIITKDFDVESVKNIHNVNENLLNVPIYYSIAYPINRDLQYVHVDETFNKYFNIDSQLEEYKNIEWNYTDIIDCNPILFFVSEGFEDLTILKNSFITLKEYCINKKIHYLAIPQSVDGQKQEVIKKLIYNAFQNTDINVCLMYGFDSDDTERSSYADMIEMNEETSKPINEVKI